MKLVAFLFLASLALESNADAKRISLSGVSVTEYGVYVSRDSKMCEGFQLTDKEAEAFLSKAVLITGEQLHDYSWLPCFVRGKATASVGSVTWEIQPLGTGHIYLPDGSSELVADETKRTYSRSCQQGPIGVGHNCYRGNSFLKGEQHEVN